MKALLTALCLQAGIYAASMTIVNDSPYILTASIMSANGEEVGKMTLSPQHQVQWQSYNLKGSRFSETPYSVIFTCQNGDEYGIVTYAQPGAYINARNSSGDKICKPQKKEKEEAQQQLDKQYKESISPEPVSP